MSTPMNVEEQLEQQPPAKKSRMDDPSLHEEPVEIADGAGATSEVHIRELEISTMDKKGELSELKMEMAALKDEFGKKLSSLSEAFQTEIAELKMKNQKLTEENKAFEEKLKKLEEMVQMNQQKISDIENEIMAPIHEMKVQLPLENWHDLLTFVPRIQLGKIVSQLGDRQFAYIIQSFLHDEIKEITLGNMRIIPPRPNVPSELPVVRIWLNGVSNMPDWPMPGNIKNFKQIDLNYVDTSVLNFLEKFHENSLLTDVNMHFHHTLKRNNQEILLRVLTQIVPLITSIDSIEIASSKIDLFKMVYNNNTNAVNSHESQLLLKEMVEKTRIVIMPWWYVMNYYYVFEDSWEDKMDWCCSWLYTPRNDGKPRMLIPDATFYNPNACVSSFIERIKKDFEMANNPVSFFIYTSRIDQYYNLEDISLENVKTNEKLVIKKKMEEDDKWKLLISRYPLNSAKKWIEANEKEISEWIGSPNRWELNRKINMDHELSIKM